MPDFVLPDLGENVTAGDVLRVLVKPGDTLAKDQPVLELETDKATIEVPSSVAGRVIEVKVKAGDKVKVGQAVLSVEGAAADSKAAPAEQPRAPAKPSPAPDNSDLAASANSAAKAPSGDGGLDRHVEGHKRPAGPDKPGVKQAPAPAAPSVRRLARELGVDINEVPGSGPDGRTSIDDVKAYAKRLLSENGRGAGVAAEPLPDFSRWGEIERKPLQGVRKKTAEHLSYAWSTIPHVTQHDLADITALDEPRRRYSKQAEQAGGNLTITAIAVKVVAAALKVFPQFNSSIDLAAGEIVYKKYVNVGIAVDTDRGLLVPVVRNADRKDIIQLSVEIAQLSEKARTRKISLEEMQGGCFSISNLGGIGGSFFTPIVNAPEVAILGISRARMKPVWRPAGGERDGDFVPRLMLPLSLAYDHRVIDGADGMRFLRWVGEALAQPFVLALHD